jgi:uncharacterized protein
MPEIDENHRFCGTCSLCCKLPYVAELNKSIDKWCQHARPGAGGCSIYSERPASCQSFICGWLSTELKVGDEWFPAHCKMIISRAAEPEPGFLIIVDPAHPNAWRREPYYGQLVALAQRSLVKIRVGRRFIRLNADSSEDQVTRTQDWIEGRPEHKLVG